MNSPLPQGLRQSEALQIPRCTFLYRFCFTCINILLEQLQPFAVRGEVEAQRLLPWALLLASSQGGQRGRCPPTGAAARQDFGLVFLVRRAARSLLTMVCTLPFN